MHDDDEWLHKTKLILENVNQLLQNRVFVGSYKERILIKSEPRPIYKDVIQIDKSEHEVIKALKSANKLITNQFQGRITTCIELKSKTSEYFVYTDLSNVTLQCHWFVINHVTMEKDVIHLAVKHLRPFTSENEAHQNSSKSSIHESFINPDIVNNVKQVCLENITLENIIYALRFLTVLCLTLIVAIYNLLLLVLKAMHEANVFFHNAVPILVACVEGITKAFGGVLILIAMMWNSNKRKLPPNRYESRNQHFAARYQANEVMMSSPSFQAYIKSRSLTYGIQPPPIGNSSTTNISSPNSVHKRYSLTKQSPITTSL